MPPNYIAQSASTPTPGTVISATEIQYPAVSGGQTYPNNNFTLSSNSVPTTGAIKKVYYSAGAQLIATPALHQTQCGASVRIITDGGSVLYYLHSDHLGSTSLTTCGTGCGTAGTLVARQLYDAWGNVRSGGGLPTDISYTGQRADAATNLLFFKARYYSSVVARFISADTIVPDGKNPQQFNRYAYGLNNPLKHIDPTGHCVKDDAECEAYRKYLYDTFGIDLQDSLERAWSAYEARLVYETLYDIATKFFKQISYKDAAELVKAAFGGTALMRNVHGYLFNNKATTLGKLIILPDHDPANGLWETTDEAWTKNVIAHELAHAWDFDEDLGKPSRGLAYEVDNDARCVITCVYKPDRNEQPVGDYAFSGSNEDWAMSFAQYIEPYAGPKASRWRNLGPLREGYVRIQIALLVTKEP